MSALIRLFWELCTFRRGPQDVPYSRFLFGSLLVIKLLFELATFFIPDGSGTKFPITIVAPYLLVDALVSIAAIYILLWLHSHTERAIQTLTAALGVDIVLGIAQLPFRILIAIVGTQADPFAIYISVTGNMVIFLWELSVYSHIFRHALSTSIFRAAGYALLLFILSIVVNYQMLPVTK